MINEVSQFLWVLWLVGVFSDEFAMFNANSIAPPWLAPIVLFNNWEASVL